MLGIGPPTTMPCMVAAKFESPSAIAASAPTRRASMRDRVPLATGVRFMIVIPVRIADQ